MPDLGKLDMLGPAERTARRFDRIAVSTNRVRGGYRLVLRYSHSTSGAERTDVSNMVFDTEQEAEKAGRVIAEGMATKVDRDGTLL